MHTFFIIVIHAHHFITQYVPMCCPFYLCLKKKLNNLKSLPLLSSLHFPHHFLSFLSLSQTPIFLSPEKMTRIKKPAFRNKAKVLMAKKTTAIKSKSSALPPLKKKSTSKKKLIFMKLPRTVQPV